MSHLFQRPLCEMGRAYDYAFRPVLGEPDVDSGGPCDDRPHPVELIAATADPTRGAGGGRSFALCPEHEAQLRRADARMPAGSRFRAPAAPAAEVGRR
jgi:hypothetical protein